MSFGRCACCNRPYRSDDARRRAENYRAIHAELRGSEPAKHLGPLSPDKIARHRIRSEVFRQRADVVPA